MILAAGLGTRLRPITYGMPKPMVPVLNRPVMEHTVRLLGRHGFREAIANLHWFPELIEDRFGDGSRFGIELSYSREEQLLGTAGGVRKAADFLGDSFLVVAGDALTDIDFALMREFHESHDGIATLATKRVDDTSEFGVVIAGADGRIQGFQEKPDPAEALSDLANTCIYMFRSEVFDFFPEPGTSKAAGPEALLEGDVPFYSHKIDAYWNDIGNLDELRQGNLDALHGEVEVEPGAPPVADGIWAATPLDGVEVTAPVMVGSGVELGEGVRIEGPTILADGCRIGDGACIRDSILLEGTEVPTGAILVGGIAARISEN